MLTKSPFFSPQLKPSLLLTTLLLSACATDESFKRESRQRKSPRSSVTGPQTGAGVSYQADDFSHSPKQRRTAPSFESAEAPRLPNQDFERDLSYHSDYAEWRSRSSAPAPKGVGLQLLGYEFEPGTGRMVPVYEMTKLKPQDGPIQREQEKMLRPPVHLALPDPDEE